jgi:hypothetical protein
MYQKKTLRTTYPLDDLLCFLLAYARNLLTEAVKPAQGTQLQKKY